MTLATVLTFALVSAPTCGQRDVQQAINTARDQDTVSVPSGTCTWTAGVSISGKNITLQGSGSTVIALSGNAIKETSPAVNLTNTRSRVTGFSFIFLEMGANEADFGVRADGEGWRVDHNTFENRTEKQNRYAIFSRRYDSVWPGGLVDHNTFLNARVVAHGTLKLTGQYDLWAQPLLLGADQGAAGVVYIEDNTFDRTIYADACDTEYAGRYVFRYNTVINGTCEAHPIFLAQRGPRAWEIYNNTFNCTLKECDSAIWPRAATGVAFNNKILGNYNYPIKLDNRRSYDLMLTNPPGPCNGLSVWDGNSDGMSGYPCRDQIGRGKDMFVYSGHGPLPPQQLDPAYFWNNTFRMNPVEPVVANCSGVLKTGGSCKDVVRGRDFVVGIPRPNYKPFVYPHPANLQ